MSGSVKEVDSSNYEEEVEKSAVPVMIDFWAPWCGPCTTISPVIDELASEYDGKVKVVKINVDTCPDIAAKYNVRGIPNFVFLKGTNTDSQIVGAVSKDELKGALDKLV